MPQKIRVKKTMEVGETGKPSQEKKFVVAMQKQYKSRPENQKQVGTKMSKKK